MSLESGTDLCVGFFKYVGWIAIMACTPINSRINGGNRSTIENVFIFYVWAVDQYSVEHIGAMKGAKCLSLHAFSFCCTFIAN